MNKEVFDKENIFGLGKPNIDYAKYFIGNGLQNQMLKVFDEHCLSINKKYLFTKVHKDNIYSIKNLEKNNYFITHEYENERGMNLALLKEI